jgi:hypothetical protein
MTVYMAKVTTPQAVALKSMPGIELVAIGSWPARTGPVTISPADLRDALAARECPSVGAPVLKLGHDEPNPDEKHMRWDGEPAVGWVANLRLSDNRAKLVGDYTGVPAWLADVMASAYPRRSVEIHKGYRCQTGHTHPFAITAVSLLGVQPPAVGVIKSLHDVQALYTQAAAGDVTPELIHKIEAGLSRPTVPLAVRVGRRVALGNVRLRFDPSQTRDFHGRWTEVGGGMKDHQLLKAKPWALNRSEVFGDESELAAWNLLKSYKAEEGKVTPQLTTLAGDHGARMQGLHNRLKTQESLARKLEQKSATKGLTPSEYAKKIGDALRYTMITKEDNYGETAQAVIDDFRKRGYVVEVENTWHPGASYKGINTNIKKDGLTFELQFHSEKSINAKGKSHALYEIARNAKASPDERARATRQMQQLWDQLQHPSGAEKVK